MSHLRIPKNWTVQRSTPFFTKENVPQALLSYHNTAEGVFGQLCVMEGQVTYYGFSDEHAQFNIHFWSDAMKKNQPMYHPIPPHI